MGVPEEDGLVGVAGVSSLYMDNRSEKFDVYQNVFWNNINNGLILNGNGDTLGNKINQGSIVCNNTFLSDADLSINLRDVDDANGSKVFDNLVSSGVAKINSTFAGGEERGNGVSGAGTTQGYTASSRVARAPNHHPRRRRSRGMRSTRGKWSCSTPIVASASTHTISAVWTTAIGSNTRAWISARVCANSGRELVRKRNSRVRRSSCGWTARKGTWLGR
jgi:hypothetical protein